MDSGSLTTQPAIELLCSLAAQKASGKLEIVQGKRKRQFWLEGGKLSYTKSNLKSESLPVLVESIPDADPSQVLQLQSTLRVMNAVAWTEGDSTFTANEAPKKRVQADLLEACWQALQRRVSGDAIQTRLAGLGGRFPRLSGGGVPLAELPLKPKELDFLRDLDGQRELLEVLDFAPVDGPTALRALYLGTLTGTVELVSRSRDVEVRITGFGDPSDQSEIARRAIERPTAPEPPPPTPEAEPPPAPSQRPDIASLIAGELGTPSTAEAAPPPPPEPESKDPELKRLQREHRRLKQAPNFFHVLGVQWDDSEADLRRAYFALAREFHPDAWSGKPLEHVAEVEEIFAILSEAWQSLGESDSRDAYIDRVIHGKKTEEELAHEKVQAILAAEDDFRVALQHFQAGRYVKAHELFQGCVAAVPEEAEFRAYLGYTTWKVNVGKNDAEAEAGVAMVRDAVDKGTKLFRGWMLMGLISSAQGDHDTARRCLIKALKMKPGDLELQRTMKRIERDRQKAEDEQKKGGLFGGFFKRKRK